MPIFEYKAFVSGGATKTGIIDANTAREARQRLRRDNILVRELHEVHGKKREKVGKAGSGRSAVRLGGSLRAKLSRFRQKSDGARGRDVEILAGTTRQLGTLLGAGIPLAEALRALIEQVEKRRIETMFRQIREDITAGKSLGDSLAEHPWMFSQLYVNMVKAGEATGNVDVVLTRLADFIQAQRAIQRKVVGALTYPAMMVALGTIVVSVLMAVVVPRIVKMLSDTGQSLPLPTQILITVSDVFARFWWLGLAIMIVCSFTIERVYRTNRGQLVIDRAVLKVPLIGDMMRKRAVSRFTRTLATLLSSGVAAVQSLEITARVVGNRVIADATDHVRTRILEGTDIATPLKATGVFPSVVGYMVAVGEQSGELEQMLDRIADAYDEEIDVVTERVTSVLEPIMIILLAGIVGFIVWSIILPILQVGSLGG